MKAIRAKSKAASSNKLSHLISRYGGKKRPAEMGVEGKAAKHRLDRPGRKKLWPGGVADERPVGDGPTGGPGAKPDDGRSDPEVSAARTEAAQRAWDRAQDRKQQPAPAFDVPSSGMGAPWRGGLARPPIAGPKEPFKRGGRIGKK